MIPDHAGNIWANTNLGLICVNPLKNDYKLANIYLDNFACDGNYIWFSDQGAIYQYDIKQKLRIRYLIRYLMEVHILLLVPQSTYGYLL